MRKLPLLYKVIALTLLGLVLVLGIAWLRLDAAIANNLKQTISTTLGVYPKIERLHYSLLNGRLEIDRLTLDNPEGFTTPYFMNATNLAIQTKPITFLAQNTELQSFTIDNIDVNIEQQLTQNNVLSILSNAKQQRKANLQANLTSNRKKFKLNRAIVNDVTARLNLALGLQAQPLTVDLPPIEAIELNNLTPDNIQGVVLSDLVDRVVSGIVKNIVAQSQQTIPENILRNLQNSPLFSENLPDPF